MLKITKRLVIAVFCLGLAFGAHAQDKKETVEEVKKVKIVVVDKDGKKHTLEEEYSGEMPESLKKKIEAFKAEMKKKGVEHFDFDLEGKDKNGFIFKEGGKEAKIKVIHLDGEGDHDLIFESLEGGELPEELKKKIEELKKQGAKDGKKIIIDMDVEDEIVEIVGPGDGMEVEGGKVVVKKDGKVILEETFEGEMSEELKNKIKEFEGEEGDIDIDIRITGPAPEGKHGKHKVIRLGDGGNKVIKIGDADLEKIEKIDVKLDEDGERKIWITKDGKTVELEGNDFDFDIKIDVEEDLDGEGTKMITKKVFVFHMLHIEDIKENDEDIPAQFRFSDQPKLDESISELSFYPNPNDGQFKLNFNLQEKGDTEISIFDLNGKEIYSEKLNDFTGSYSKEVNLQNQPKGLYILKISQGDKVLSKKLVLE